MSIQFECPSCRNPIEIDDEWGGQAVACPYCRKSVTAPHSSTFAPPETLPSARAVPDATPWGSDQGWGGPASTDQQIRGSAPEFPASSNIVAVWALILSIASNISFIAVSILMAPRIIDIVGENIAPDEAKIQLEQYVSEQLKTHNQLPDWMVMCGFLLLLVGVCWVSGLICSLVALRSPFRRKFVYVAFGMLSLIPLLLLLE